MTELPPDVPPQPEGSPEEPQPRVYIPPENGNGLEAVLRGEPPLHEDPRIVEAAQTDPTLANQLRALQRAAELRMSANDVYGSMARAVRDYARDKGYLPGADSGTDSPNQQ